MWQNSVWPLLYKNSQKKIAVFFLTRWWWMTCSDLLLVVSQGNLQYLHSRPEYRKPVGCFSPDCGYFLILRLSKLTKQVKSSTETLGWLSVATTRGPLPSSYLWVMSLQVILFNCHSVWEILLTANSKKYRKCRVATVLDFQKMKRFSFGEGLQFISRATHLSAIFL